MENKQPTVEETILIEDFINFLSDNDFIEGFSFFPKTMIQALYKADFRIIKESGYQQLTDQLSNFNTLKDRMASTFEKMDGMVFGNKRMTGKELAGEIRNETKIGLTLVNDMIQLAIDLVKRDKVNHESKLQQLTAENERLREALNSSYEKIRLAHDEVAKLPISMEKYLPISYLLLDAKDLLKPELNQPPKEKDQ